MLAQSSQLASALVAVALIAATPARASVEISSGRTSNMNCSAGVCSPTAKKAVLNVNDLTSMLASADATVKSGKRALTITVFAPFSWTSTHRLTLDAYYNVGFRAPVTVAGQGAVTITTNDGGTNGGLIFGNKGTLTFWDLSSNLTIEGNSFILAGDIKTLAAEIASNPSGFYALANDYDASVDETYRTSPIDTLSGVFEGLGHSISDLLVLKRSGPGLAGLFSQISSGGKVLDLGISHSRIRGSIAGILAGLSYGTIMRCHSDGRVHGRGTEGGLVGVNFGTISDSHSSAQLYGGNANGGAAAGGLAGENFGTVSHSYATGNVSGIFAAAGGLVGTDYGLVSQSHATGNITNSNEVNDATGGLVGDGAVGEKISRSYATGSVVGHTRAGGLIGLGQTIDQSFATGEVRAAFAGGLLGQEGANVSNSYSKGSVFGTLWAAGGFEGYANANIESSYSTSAVSVTGGLAGGFIGEDGEGSHASAFWDLDTSGISDPSRGAGNIPNDPGITGLTDAQLKSGLPAGFDPNIWGQSPNINNGYPYLIANPPQ